MSLLEGTHGNLFGYLLWGFGFTGSHRFYYGRPISGTIYFLTFGVFLVGWIVDLFLIPSMAHSAENHFSRGRYDYNLSWILLTFLGLFGIHRIYIGKWITGILYMLTAGLFGAGYVYDYWTWNRQVAEANGQAG